MKISLKNPVSPFKIIQGFGVNGTYYQAHGINIIGHNGMDLQAYHGQPIYASHDGTAYYEIDTDQGHGVIVITDKQYDYLDGQSYFKTIYWHMVDSSKEPQFKSPVEGHTITGTGLPVKAGDLLGYADSTGFSSGDHLHWALKPVYQGESPQAWYNLVPNNGYLGCIDQTPYLENAPKHIFSVDCSLGETNEEVRQLQLRLQSLGYFPLNQTCTGFFGSITRASVFRFQLDHIPNLSLYARYIARGSYCAEQTRNALNSL